MESPSAPPRRGHLPRQELLLAVSLLTFWNPPTTAQLTVESVPPDAAEGKDVLLRVHSLPGDLVGLSWFRGASLAPSRQILSYVVDTQVTIPGPAYSGRETIYPNGSLLFQRVTVKDTGYYTLQIVRRDVRIEEVTGQLRVFPRTGPGLSLTVSCVFHDPMSTLIQDACEGITGTIQGNVLSLFCTADLPKPNITSNNSHPVENADSVVLTCEPQTQSTSYLWSVNRKSLPASARLELSLDNRTLTIHRVTRNDTGPYECETRNPVSAGRSDPFTLNVLYDPDSPTVSPSDSHYHQGASLRLSATQTLTHPHYILGLSMGGPSHPHKSSLSPNITGNDSGAYTCIASNSGTGLNKTTVKTITVSGSTTGLPVGSIIGITVMVLVGLAL
uniref:Ig-like domain-containing protein n=1 Tax=Ursus americanus TaxID=9643 RepID=A0A452SD21_URSAM